MTDEPRISPVPPEEWDDETRAILEGMGPLGPMNIFSTLANHPKLLKRWLVFGGHILAKNTLPARERELAILRVGWRCDSDYEFGQHTLIGSAEGIDDAEIVELTRAELDSWSVGDATLLRAVDELVSDQRISDATWDELVTSWSRQQVMDLVFTVGQYVMTCMALKTFGVERDEGIPGFPS